MRNDPSEGRAEPAQAFSGRTVRRAVAYFFGAAAAVAAVGGLVALIDPQRVAVAGIDLASFSPAQIAAACWGSMY